jgi:anion-transporting  ArsA/GET3 family ATPase
LPITSLSDKRILFVSGKGGVGKSLVAAGLAKELADSGKRVLLAEIGETSYYRDFWGLKAEITHSPIKHPTERFDLALWSGETSLREYVLFYLKMERLYNLFFENKVMRALVNVAPGLSEIAILGKITSGIRKVGPPMNYDVIVVDSYATGHALALLEAPKGMMEAIKFGPMGHHSREMNQVIRDETKMSYLVVTLLEELPVTESIEFRDKLKLEFGVSPIIVANKVMKAPVNESEIAESVRSSNLGLAEFARHVKAVNERQDKYEKMLTASGAHIVDVPLIFSADPNELTSKTGEALRALL